jgi:F-type H+-transporting ATPase subunit delta
MADLRVASRYLKSLLNLGVEQKALDAVHADMQAFSKVCKENRPFAMMLRSPVIRHEQKKAILTKVFSGRVHPLTLAIFEILTRKNRESLLPTIAAEFHNAYNEHKGIGKAYITTTVPMDNEFRKAVEVLVKKLNDKKQIEMIEKVDPELIGGFVLNVEDRQIDASIKSKLKALNLKFNENYFIKEL